MITWHMNWVRSMSIWIIFTPNPLEINFLERLNSSLESGSRGKTLIGSTTHLSASTFGDLMITLFIWSHRLWGWDTAEEMTGTSLMKLQRHTILILFALTTTKTYTSSMIGTVNSLTSPSSALTSATRPNTLPKNAHQSTRSLNSSPTTCSICMLKEHMWTS